MSCCEKMIFILLMRVLEVTWLSLWVSIYLEWKQDNSEWFIRYCRSQQRFAWYCWTPYKAVFAWFLSLWWKTAEVHQPHWGCSRHQTIVRLLSWHLSYKWVTHWLCNQALSSSLCLLGILAWFASTSYPKMSKSWRESVHLARVNSSLQAVGLFDKVPDVIIVFPGRCLMIGL